MDNFESIEVATNNLLAKGIKDDTPTGSTPRKRKWKYTEVWSLTKSRDELLSYRKQQRESADVEMAHYLPWHSLCRPPFICTFEVRIYHIHYMSIFCTHVYTYRWLNLTKTLSKQASKWPPIRRFAVISFFRPLLLILACREHELSDQELSNLPLVAYDSVIGTHRTWRWVASSIEQKEGSKSNEA